MPDWLKKIALTRHSSIFLDTFMNCYLAVLTFRLVPWVSKPLVLMSVVQVKLPILPDGNAQKLPKMMKIV